MWWQESAILLLNLFSKIAKIVGTPTIVLIELLFFRKRLLPDGTEMFCFQLSCYLSCISFVVIVLCFKQISVWLVGTCIDGCFFWSHYCNCHKLEIQHVRWFVASVAISWIVPSETNKIFGQILSNKKTGLHLGQYSSFLCNVWVFSMLEMKLDFKVLSLPINICAEICNQKN